MKVKVTVWGTHIVERPLKAGFKSFLGERVLMLQLCQGYKRLGGGMDINRIQAVMVVLWLSIRKEKETAIKMKALVNGFGSLGEIGKPANFIKTDQVESRVETINPLLVWSFAIRPRAIFSLVTNTKFGCSDGRFPKHWLLSGVIHAGQ